MGDLLYVGDTLQWRDTGGDYAITLASLAAGTGRQGGLADLSAVFDGDKRSRRYRWRFFCEFATAPIVGETVSIYAKTGDGTNRDNDDGVADAAVSAEDKLNNLTLIGTLVVDEAAQDVRMSIGGEIEIVDEEFAPVIWNGSAGDNLTATAANNGFDLTPVR